MPLKTSRPEEMAKVHMDIKKLLQLLAGQVNPLKPCAASQHRHEECVKILLESGANPSAADATRNTALHYVVCSDSPAIVATLMEYNVDLEAKAKSKPMK